MSLRCWLGQHKWAVPEGRGWVERRLIQGGKVVSHYWVRSCTRCGHVQRKEIHS